MESNAQQIPGEVGLNAGSPYEIGVYYFPNYHRDPRNEKRYGPGWTEWELVKKARPRFPGHEQPKVPLWGYEDEADPAVMAKKIDAAADHGINHFIFDWYWHDQGPFLDRGLREGFLPAPNAHRLKFALMWANHDWVELFPARLKVPPSLHYPGAVTRETFDQVAEHVIETYFRHPSYWKIEGCPYFSIYELMTLIRGLGGIEKTREALEHFRARTRAAGFPDLHLNAVVWGIQALPNAQRITNPRDLLAALPFKSITSYVWVHHVPLRDFPVTSYADVMKEAVAYWGRAREEFPLPYHPNVSMGWDASPRTSPEDAFADAGYPYMAVLRDNTPAHFQAALAQAKSFLEEHPGHPRILNINSWNEWTEGSYLEPDTVHGLAYLEAIRAVFPLGKASGH
jgi:hypothetical protein